MISKFKLFESYLEIDYAVKINNEEEYNFLMKMVEEEGIYSWMSGISPTKFKFKYVSPIIYFNADKDLGHSDIDFWESSYGGNKLLSLEEYKKICPTFKKLKNLEVDPFEEENWGYVKEQKLFESANVNYVVLVTNEEEYNKVMEIVEKEGIYSWGTKDKKLPPTTPRNSFSGNEMFIYFNDRPKQLGSSNRNFWIISQSIEKPPLYTASEYINEKTKKKMSNPEVDPFDEENWGYVQETIEWWEEEPLFDGDKRLYDRL